MARTDAKHAFILDFQDEGSCDNPARSLGAMQKLVNMSRVRFVVSGCLSGTKAIGALAKQHDVLLLSSGLLDRDVLAQRYPLVNFATEIAGESQYLAELIVDAGVRRLAAFRPVDAFGEEVGETLKRLLAKSGVEIVSNELVAQDVQDFRTLLLRLKSTKADALFMNTLGKDQQLMLMRQLGELRLDLPVFGNYVIEASVTAESEKKLLEGVRYTHPINSAAESPQKSVFDNKFRARFGKNELPSANTYFVYDGLMLLDQALNQCVPTDTDCVRRAMTNGNTRQGISGDFTIKADGSCVRPYGFKQVRDGKFEWTQMQVTVDPKL